MSSVVRIPPSSEVLNPPPPAKERFDGDRAVDSHNNPPGRPVSGQHAWPGFDRFVRMPDADGGEGRAHGAAATQVDVKFSTRGGEKSKGAKDQKVHLDPSSFQSVCVSAIITPRWWSKLASERCVSRSAPEISPNLPISPAHPSLLVAMTALSGLGVH